MSSQHLTDRQNFSLTSFATVALFFYSNVFRRYGLAFLYFIVLCGLIVQKRFTFTSLADVFFLLVVGQSSKIHAFTSDIASLIDVDRYSDRSHEQYIYKCFSIYCLLKGNFPYCRVVPAL